MKILYVTSEANPFAASGGLGDVMGALPVAVHEEGVETSVIMPLYDTMKAEHKAKLEKVIDISFNLSWRQTGTSIYKIDHQGVTYYFVENFRYFSRGRLYGEYDDAERFAFFSKAVVEFMIQGNYVPDILHANDWQTALTVIYLKTEFSNHPMLTSIKTVYTIHNIEYQGQYGFDVLGNVFGISGNYMGVLEYDGCINLMKGAIVASDYVTTVSPNYANELEYDFFSFGLSPIVKAAKYKISGVINGIDYGYFSPEKGGDIVKKFTTRTVKSGKAANKKALQEELGLEVRPDVPLLVMITRLTAGKGIDLVLHILEEVLREDVQVVILGTGDKEYENRISEMSKHHSNLVALIKFDRVISKKMYASADIFVMPSKSEPCGLAQMIACSYGTVPVVRAVGGLFDSIKPYGTEDENGFTFDNYNAHELLYTVKNALSIYKNDKEWSVLVRSAMRSDFSWRCSALEYIRIYKRRRK